MISRGGVQTDTRTGEPFEMPLLGRGRTDARALTVDTWKAMTSQYCRERRKKVLVSAEIAAPADTDLSRVVGQRRCQLLGENHQSDRVETIADMILTIAIVIHSPKHFWLTTMPR